MKKINISKSQILLIVSAVLYLTGAVFMLVNTFADATWAFWTGLVLAVVATAFYVTMFVIEKRAKKVSYSGENPNKNSHENETEIQ